MKLTWVSLLGLLGVACVTPQGVKDASHQHAANLIALSNQVAKYRATVAAYYDALELKQRDAYVAQMGSKDLDEAVLSQLESLSAKRSLPDTTSNDFIETGARLTGQKGFWARHFDFWVLTLPGDSLEAKRAALAERIKVARNAQSNAPPDQAAIRTRLVATLEQTAKETDDDLTYPSIAIDLRRQRANLDQQLELLSKQVDVMQAFHGIVNQYLSIDATIDGKKIAEAAEAGAKVDSTVIGGVIQTLRGQP